MLPFDWHGCLQVPRDPEQPDEREALLRRLERALAPHKPRWIRREGATIHFRGGSFRWVTNWNLLVSISTGSFTVEETPAGPLVCYRLRFTGMVVGSTVAVLLLAVWLTTMAGMSRPPVLIFVVMWLWLVGGNLAITLLRFSRFMRRACGFPHRP
ncbi:MAG TPA: hypothetical protein VF746_10500 [Longimicrobium sp.]